MTAIAKTATTPAATPAPKRERWGSGSGPTRRRWIESQRSGIGRSPSGSNRSFRSRIAVFLQQLPEPPPACAQVDVDRGAARTDRRRHLGDRPVGVVVQHHRQTLVRRELPKRRDHVSGGGGVLAPGRAGGRFHPPPPLHPPPRRADRPPPHPSGRL